LVGAGPHKASLNYEEEEVKRDQETKQGPGDLQTVREDERRQLPESQDNFILRSAWFASSAIAAAIPVYRAEGKTLHARIGLSREGAVTISTLLADAQATDALALCPVCRMRLDAK